MSRKPSRTVVTILGAILGVAAVVAVLGLTATASGQVSAAFSVLTATQVTVTDAASQPSGTGRSYNFPDGADGTIGTLNGVLHAGRSWAVGGGALDVAAAISTAGSAQMSVAAASPGYLRALDPTLLTGTLFDQVDEDQQIRVAILGIAAARQLGVTDLAGQPVVFIQGVGFSVVGVISNVQREPASLSEVFIPASTALALFGEPLDYSPASMLIETRIGAAQVVASQAAIALRPDNPAVFQVLPPPDPHTVEGNVLGSLDTLFLVLAGITLLVGAAGIANTTLVSVIERTHEIGLRRAVGARPRHIAMQILTESAVLGTLGGLIGTTLGIACVLGVALARSWTAVLDPSATALAPLIGTVTGILAGLYPALGAARIQPVRALRR